MESIHYTVRLHPTGGANVVASQKSSNDWSKLSTLSKLYVFWQSMTCGGNRAGQGDTSVVRSTVSPPTFKGTRERQMESRAGPGDVPVWPPGWAPQTHPPGRTWLGTWTDMGSLCARPDSAPGGERSDIWWHRNSTIFVNTNKHCIVFVNMKDISSHCQHLSYVTISINDGTKFDLYSKFWIFELFPVLNLIFKNSKLYKLILLEYFPSCPLMQNRSRAIFYFLTS